MKSLKRLSTFLMFVIPVMAIGQSSGIDAAINKGNAAELSTFLADKVDVSIVDQDASLSAGEAVKSLSGFFSQNTVKSYKRAHLTPATNGRASYSLGDLSTSTGMYRVYLYYDAKQKISEIRVEK
ncbi:MAG: DUF4783 domain-containing protein [Saprospiraceae bacterium]